MSLACLQDAQAEVDAAVQVQQAAILKEEKAAEAAMAKARLPSFLSKPSSDSLLMQLDC